MNLKKLKNFILNFSTAMFTHSTLNFSFMPPNFNLIFPLQFSPTNLHVERISKKKNPHFSSPMSTSPHSQTILFLRPSGISLAPKLFSLPNSIEAHSLVCPLLTLLSWFWSFLFWSAELLVSATMDCLFQKIISISRELSAF